MNLRAVLVYAMERIAMCLLLTVLAILQSGIAAPEVYAAERLSVTYVASPLNIPTIIEKHENMFAKAFPDMAIILPELNAGPKQTAAMAAGEVDIAHCLGATSAILAASEGLDLKVIGIYSRAPKAFMIMAKDPDILSVSDLKGRKIGGPKGTILHQLLASAAFEAGMSVSDYEFINMGLQHAAAALSSGSIDAALLAGPDAYRAAKSGARTLVDGVGHVDGTTVIAATKHYLDKNGETAGRFMKMHEEALSFIDSNKDRAFAIAADETGLPVDAVREMYGWYDFSPGIKPSDIEELVRTQNFMLENGLQRNKIEIESIFAPIDSEK